MIFRSLGVFGRKRAGLGGFLPNELNNLELWLDSDDSTTLNAKMGAQFTSANSEFLSSSSAAFQKTSQDYSFGGWFQYDNATGSKGLCSKWNASNQGTLFYMAGNQPKLFAGGSSLSSVVSSNLVVDTWYFGVCVIDITNDLIKISINNETYITAAFTVDLIDPTEDFMLGQFKSSAYLGGKMDNWFYYDKVLSEAQKTVLWNAGAGMSYENLSADSLTSLVSWWSMNEQSGTRIDEVGANNLTDNATVTYALGHVQEPIAANDYVWRWTDKSDNAYNFDQATASNQPQYKSTGFGTNSVSYLLFDGVDDFLEKTGITQNQPMTIFISGQSAGNSQTFFDGDDSTNSVKISKTATNYNVNSGSSLNGDANDTNDVLITIIVNNTGSSIQINDETAITGTSGAKVLDAFRIGKDNAGAEFLSGKVNQILVYNSELSAANKTSVKNYINNIGGIY